ncbi:unnamed protein product [Rhizoctonia solani]|uniref:F-box domain-containing protein n=1 Tax=Rhizoctonia solani TaxID=456999 RepID=A0A8H3B1R9_9AGAM|nr:unnamed protein product [Rhizoctonia solani]
MDPLAPTSIKKIPPEILAHIFLILHDANRCLAIRELRCLNIPRKSLGYPNQPHTLSHVCSTWRRVALATSSLWSHIDIAIHHELNHQLLARAKIYAQRAGSRALDIHLCDPGLEHQHSIDISPVEYGGPYEFEFLDAYRVSIKSLIFDIYILKHVQNVHFAALEYFLAKCTVGTLTNYSMRVYGRPPILSIEAPEHPELNITGHKLEELWRSVKTVQLHGLGPRWNSALYHGLVDLRLGPGTAKITEPQVINILKASPALRVLHLKNCIDIRTARRTSLAPVQLNNLEVLNIECFSLGPPLIGQRLDDGEIVRWIQPGVKPLRFAFFGQTTQKVVSFFERSNVTTFYTRGWEPLTLRGLLRTTSGLQTLILNGFGCKISSFGAIVNPVSEEDSVTSPTSIRIDTIYLINFGGLKLGDIQGMIDQYSVRRLFLQNCYLADQFSIEGKGTEFFEDIRAKLSKIKNCPIVESLCGADRINPDDWE